MQGCSGGCTPPGDHFASKFLCRCAATVRIAPFLPQVRYRVQRMIRIVFSGLLALGLPASLSLGQSKEPAKLTPESFRGLALRNITSTLSSGRIADIAVDPRNRSVWYVASASGGVWKTTNRGV